MGDEAAPPPEPGRPRAELADTPPFFTWRTIYLIVLGALAAEIVVAAFVTGLYR
jgi:hypothetical protein